MQRSVLLLGIFAILLCAAVALPTGLSRSEEDWLEKMLVESENSGELQDLDYSSGSHAVKRSAKDSSSSEENKKGAKDKANSSGSSSSEEKLTTGTAVHAEETTTEPPARKRREIVTRRPNMEMDLLSDLISKDLQEILTIDLSDKSNPSDPVTKDFVERNYENFCHRLEENSVKKPDLYIHYLWVKEVFCDGREPRRRREAADKDQQKHKVTSEESELDYQAGKELEEEMARATADIFKILNSKDNTSIEDYAQGCEVMEVSSKEANEATYAE